MIKAKNIVAYCNKQTNGPLTIEKLVYPNIYIPNRGFALSLSLRDEDDADVISTKKEVNEYNEYVEYLLALDGFAEKFEKNGYYLSKEQVESYWGENSTERVFGLKNYRFQTPLCILDDWIMLRQATWEYYVEIDGERIEFITYETDGGYPREIKIANKRYNIMWNWTDDERDFCYYLWDYACQKDILNSYEEDPVKSYSYFESYMYGRYDMAEPDHNLMRALNILKDMGYLRTYYITPEIENPIWKLRSNSEGKIGMMLLDMSFEKNQLAMEKIKLVLNCGTEDANKSIVVNEYGKLELTDEKGKFGGHNKLMIYGRLDCPSANRYVKNGQYVQHRVFFKDEETAVKAGYRPCGKCMPEAYKKWKMSNQKV